LYLSTNIIRQIKSRRMRWAGHVARMGEEIVQGFGGSSKERDHSKDRDLDRRIGLEWMLRRLVGGCGVDSVCSG
jgi:hypothetical protein